MMSTISLRYDYGEIDPSGKVKTLDLLLSLVVAGKMDPWEIDIVEISDRYLEKLGELRELDLRISARTILAASIVVRLKSEAVPNPAATYRRSERPR